MFPGEIVNTSHGIPLDAPRELSDRERKWVPCPQSLKRQLLQAGIPTLCRNRNRQAIALSEQSPSGLSLRVEDESKSRKTSSFFLRKLMVLSLSKDIPKQEKTMERQKVPHGYIHHWEDKPREQVVEETLSWSHETKRVPDPYKFIFQDGKLISPITGEPIENSIDRSTPLARKEAGALESIQDWVRENDSGVSVWISPPHPRRTTDPNVLDSKVIVSEILFEGQEKILFNRAFIFAMDGKDCVEAANNLPYKVQEQDVFDPEFLRQHPLFLQSPLEANINKTLQEHFPDPRQWTMAIEGEDLIIKEENRPLAEKWYREQFEKTSGVVYETGHEARHKNNSTATIEQLFGQYNGSCPPSMLPGNKAGAFEVLFQNSQIEGSRTLCCTCPFCKKEVEAPIKNGKIHCPKCGESASWSS